ncbi:kelch domain-containing protein 2 [Ciona intestinalis]
MDDIKPVKRSGHVAVVWNNNMYIWGGYNESDDLIERRQFSSITWKYDLNRNKWSKQTTGNYKPSERLGSCVSCVDGKMIVFAGCVFPDDQNDINVLDLRKMEWKSLQPTGVPPSSRNKLSCCIYYDRIIYFGGYGPNPKQHEIRNGEYIADTSVWRNYRGWNNHLFAYDINTNAWITLPNKGDVPCPRAAHTMTSVEDKAFLFGGRHKNERLNDFHQLCLKTFTWTALTPSSPYQPIGRSWHSCIAINRKTLFLFGGLDTQQNVLCDEWLYCLHNNEWIKLNKPNSYPRLWHTACTGAYHGQVVVFGGCRSNIFADNQEHCNDIIFFNLQPKPLLRICLEVVTLHGKKLLKKDVLPKSLYEIVSKMAGEGG